MNDSGKMKLLLLCHNFQEYGTFFRAFQLGKHLVKSGHVAVLMLVSRERKWSIKRYEREGVWIIECPHYQPFINDKEDGWGPLDILLRCLYGLTHRCDVVVGFGHKPDIAIPALLLKYLKGVSFVADWCDLWGEGGIFSVRGLLKPERRGGALDRTLVRFETRLEKLVVRRADAVTVICSSIKKICEKMGIESGRVLLLRSGCDTEGIQPIDRDLARKKLGLPGGKILEYVGNYHQEAAFLFRAFGEIASSRDDVHLLVVGPPYPDRGAAGGGAATEGERVFRELPENVRSRILWAGKKRYDELPPYLAAADIHLLPMEPTRLEIGRWPNKISDYLASGRPVAATNVGDAGPFIREKRCGIVSRPEVGDYCSLLLASIDDEKLLQRLGLQARLVAERELSWQTITNGFLRFIAESREKDEKEPSVMRKILSKTLLAAYTILVILFEGVYLLLAWAAIKLGWEPKRRER